MNPNQNTLFTPAWLSRSWITLGAKEGTLRYDASTLSFTDSSGNTLFSCEKQDIKNLKHTGGWLFVVEKNGSKHKIAFFDPRPFTTKYMKKGIEEYGIFSGSLGTNFASLSAISQADKVAELWEDNLIPRHS